MGLLPKNMFLMICFGSFSLMMASDNISTLVSTLAQPNAMAAQAAVHSTTVQETTEPANPATPSPASATPAPVTTTPVAPAPVAPVVTAPVAAPTVPPAVTPVVPVTPTPAPVSTPLVPVPIAQPSIAPVVTPVASEIPKVVAPVVEPAMPKIMPSVAVSPVQVEPAVQPGIPGSLPKMIKAPTPHVSKSVSSPVQIVDVPDDEKMGLDTLHIDSSGNWLEKRIWYQKGEQLYEVIRNSLQKASDLRMQFVHAVNQVGHKIDEFYESISFEKGEIDEMLSAVLQALANQTQIRGGDLSSPERDIKFKIQSEQKQFESLSKDLKLIEDLDEQIDKTMMKAFKEIDACRGLENRAWNNFKEIGQELDDKKARVLYYEMENFHKNIDQKMNYLTSNLLPYLQNQLVEKVDETMNQIKNVIQVFHSQGLNLRNLLVKDEQGDFLILKQRVEEQVQSEQKAKQSEVLECTWYARIWCGLLSFAQSIFAKFHEWFCVAICFVQSIFCKIHEWICRLFGS